MKLPHIKVNSVDEYFLIPKNKRERYGIYLLPDSLPGNLDFTSNSDWDKFSRRIRKEYPIQGWFRECFLDYDNPLYRGVYNILSVVKDVRNNIKRFIRPLHPRLRKYTPHRYQQMDIPKAIIEINFAMVLDFWYEEVLRDQLHDWKEYSEISPFYNWIINSVDYIEKRRPLLVSQLDMEYDKIDYRSKIPYKIKYKEVIRIEEELKTADSRILKEIIDYRDFFWV